MLSNETAGENCLRFDSVYIYIYTSNTAYIVSINVRLCLQSKAVVVWICFCQFKQKPFKTLIFNKHLNQLLWVDPRTITSGNLLNAYFIWLSTFSFKHQAGTQHYNSFDVGFAKPALETKNYIESFLLCLRCFFCVKFRWALNLALWLCTAFIWCDLVSLDISNHFHTAHNIRGLLFVKQQMRLMLSSGEKFNIIC